MIKLGVCTGTENAKAAAKAGFDYLELGFGHVGELSEEEYQKLKEEAAASPLPVESMNSMMPGYFKLCGPEGTGEEVTAFLQKAFGRAGELGVKIVVFGSGAARSLPDGMEKEEGEKYLTAFLKTACRIAAPYGIRVAVEPLRSQESNILHHVTEAQALAAQSGAENAGALADLYHMAAEKDDMGSLDNGIGVIHAHIAHPDTREYPVKGDGAEKVYEAFFAHLKNAGYDGRVSIEGHCNDFEKEAQPAFELLDSLR